VILFIIFGTRGVTFTKEKGEFHCPQCGGGSPFKHKSVRRFFTLYFIPVIPLDRLGEYIECERCQGTYNVEILDYDPEAQVGQVQALFMVAMKQVMIGMLLADGHIDDQEVTELQQIFEDLAKVEVTEQDLREEIANIQAKGINTLELASDLAGELNDNGKEMVVRSAYRIAAADGSVDPTEMDFLHQLATALQLSSAHLKGIMAESIEHSA